MIIKLINIASLFPAVVLRVRFPVVWQAWWRETLVNWIDCWGFSVVPDGCRFKGKAPRKSECVLAWRLREDLSESEQRFHRMITKRCHSNLGHPFLHNVEVWSQTWKDFPSRFNWAFHEFPRFNECPLDWKHLSKASSRVSWCPSETLLLTWMRDVAARTCCQQVKVLLKHAQIQYLITVYCGLGVSWADFGETHQDLSGDSYRFLQVNLLVSFRSCF